MSKIANGKKLTPDESRQILCRMRELFVTQSNLANYLTVKGAPMGPSNLGKLIRGEISGKNDVFLEIETFLSKTKKTRDQELKIRIKNGLTSC